MPLAVVSPHCDVRQFIHAQASPIIGRSIWLQSTRRFAGKLVKKSVRSPLLFAEHMRTYFTNGSMIADSKNLTIQNRFANQGVHLLNGMDFIHGRIPVVVFTAGAPLLRFP